MGLFWDIKKEFEKIYKKPLWDDLLQRGRGILFAIFGCCVREIFFDFFSKGKG